ncbi:hypothetical protein H4S04_000128 [Coemansia sp. S16]|nr:hypothetical protein H4S04_000128 [Coemansia sp. S16]
MDTIFYPQLLGQAIEYYFYPNSSVPVFCPTASQFSDFEALVSAIEPLSVRAGICKIIPPRQWREDLESRQSLEFDEAEFPIMKPIVQHFNGSRGIFHQYNVEFHRKLRLAQFFQMSQDASHRAPEIKPHEEKKKEEEEEVVEPRVSETVGIAVDYGTGQIRLTTAAAEALRDGTRSDAQRAKFVPAAVRYRVQPDVEDEPAADHNGVRPGRQFTADDGRALFVGAREYAENEELERIYWKNLLFQPPMYGADVLGSLFPAVGEFPTWNIRELPGLLRLMGQRMPGVNDPYLYLGMWKATFAWHVEDMDLYSINYIHFGAPKAWYAIPVEAHSRFEMSMQNVFANDHKSCAQFLRHKAFLLSPRFLAQQGIPFHRVVQRAGEIMITFPNGYHAGFNHGFNCAESVNFALERWLDVAWDSKHCECVKDSVTIDLMKWFGDVHMDRLKRQQQKEQRDVRVSPRRHAAAAAAALSPPAAQSRRGRSATAAKAGEEQPKPSSGGSPKRKPSSSIAPQCSAKRSHIASDSVSPHYASLHTPVGICGGCLQSTTSAAIECVQCGLTVHPQCAGISADDGSYKCANCVMDTDQLSCGLCGFQNGILLPVRRPGGLRGKPVFAHYLCANFVPATFFEYPAGELLANGEWLARAKTKPVGGESTVSTRSRTAGRPVAAAGGPMKHWARVCGVSSSSTAGACAVCCQNDFVTVACAEPMCQQSVHPMCAATHCLSPALVDWSKRLQAASVRDIRVLFARSVTAVDGGRVEELTKENRKLAYDLGAAKSEVAEYRLKSFQMQNEVTKLRAELDEAFKKSQWRELEYENLLRKFNALVNERTDEFPDNIDAYTPCLRLRTTVTVADSGCSSRVLAFDPHSPVIYASHSQPGQHTMAIIDIDNPRRTLISPHLHSMEIRGAEVSPNIDGTKYLLTASHDKTAALTALGSNGTRMAPKLAARLKLGGSGWSCAWDPSNSNLCYVGMAAGSVSSFDLRNTAKPLYSWSGVKDRVCLLSEVAGETARNAGYSQIYGIAVIPGTLGSRLVVANSNHVYALPSVPGEPWIQLTECDGQQRSCYSLSYDMNLGCVAASFRTKVSGAGTTVHELYSANVNEGSLDWRLMRRIPTTSPQNKIARSAVFSYTPANMEKRQGLFCAVLEASRSVNLWSIDGESSLSEPLILSDVGAQEDIVDVRGWQWKTSEDTCTIFASLTNSTIRLYDVR